MSKLIELNINQNINNEVFSTKNQELNDELIELSKEREEVLNSKKYIQKEEKRLKTIEKELEKYQYADQIRDKIEEYFKNNNGTCD